MTPTAQLVLDDEAFESLITEVTERVLAKLEASRSASLTPIQPPGYLNTSEAAIYLGCSRQRLYDLVSARMLRVQKEGRRSLYRRQDLEALVQSCGPDVAPSRSLPAKHGY